MDVLPSSSIKKYSGSESRQVLINLCLSGSNLLAAHFLLGGISWPKSWWPLRLSEEPLEKRRTNKYSHWLAYNWDELFESIKKWYCLDIVLLYVHFNNLKLLVWFGDKWEEIFLHFSEKYLWVTMCYENFKTKWRMISAGMCSTPQANPLPGTSFFLMIKLTSKECVHLFLC